MKKFILSVSLVGICLFTATAAFAEPMYGVLMVVKGSVKITNAGKTADGKVGGKVYEGDKIATGADSRAKIVMSDRNVINVSPDSEFIINKYENDPASGNKNVEMNLLKGKVRNNVEQTYDGEKNKFLIKTPTAVAGVRGTQFLAGFDPSTRMTSVVTFKGSVTLTSLNPQGKPVGAPVIVKKGEMTQSAPDTAPEAPKAVPKEDMKKMDGESTASNSQKQESSASAEPTTGGSNSNNGEQKRETASESPSANSPVKEVPSAPSMVDTVDVNPTTIPPSPGIGPTPAPTVMPTPPPPPPTPPPIPPSGKTNVNIRPVKQN